jgi:Na+/melibiose symporter-like transporter
VVLLGFAGNRCLQLFSLILMCIFLASGMVAGPYFFLVSAYLQNRSKFGHDGLTVALIGFSSSVLWDWIDAIIGKHRMLAIRNLSTVLTLTTLALIRPGEDAFRNLMVVFGSRPASPPASPSCFTP